MATERDEDPCPACSNSGPNSWRARWPPAARDSAAYQLEQDAVDARTRASASRNTASDEEHAVDVALDPLGQRQPVHGHVRADQEQGVRERAACRPATSWSSSGAGGARRHARAAPSRTGARPAAPPRYEPSRMPAETSASTEPRMRGRPAHAPGVRTRARRSRRRGRGSAPAGRPRRSRRPSSTARTISGSSRHALAEVALRSARPPWRGPARRGRRPRGACPRAVSSSSSWPEKTRPLVESRFRRMRSGVDRHALHDVGEAAQHVVEGQEAVGHDHALDRGVADVALVPERDVLQRGQGVGRAPARARPVTCSQPTGLRLWGMAEEPFWPSPNGSSTSRTSVFCRCADLGARTSPGSRRDQRQRRSCTSAWRSRCSDLRGDGRGRAGRAARRPPPRPRAARCENVPTAPDSLPTAIVSRARASRAAVARELVVPQRQLQAEGHGLGVHAVGAPDHRRVLVLWARPPARRAISARTSASDEVARRRASGRASAVSTTSDEVSP